MTTGGPALPRANWMISARAFRGIMGHNLHHCCRRRHEGRMAGPTKTFYIFYGTDDLSVEEAVQKLRDGMGANGDLNTSEFEGAAASVPEIINAVSSYPFLAEKRLVIVKGMLAHLSRKGAGETGKKAVEALLRDLPTLPEYARLVFVERGELSEKDNIVALAGSAPNGYVKNFAAPKDLSAWITRRARDAYGVEIQPAAAAALAAVVADDLRRADNELVKLSCYVAPDAPITEADVAALTPYVAEANIFRMVDAMAEGRGQVALRLMHRLLEDKENSPFSLYGMITRQFRNLLLTREYLGGGGGLNGLAGAIGVSPYATKDLARQSRAFSLEELEKIYRTLLDTDEKMKTGKIAPELALDLLVTGLAR
jgi:DNA polymerase-3 subunit delta